MTINSYTDFLLEPIYVALGVPIDFTLQDMVTQFQLIGLDKTSGVEVLADDIDVSTVQPACIIRMSDLVNLGYSVSQLNRALVEFNGKSWQISHFHPKPSPNGEADGELYIILEGAPD